MSQQLRIRIFAHSFVSCWNHGNAHFLRGLFRALVRMGHNVRGYEQLGSWSLSNLVKQEGESAIDAIDHFRATYPEIDVHFYRDDEGFDTFLREQLKEVDLVLIHEWTDPHVANRVLHYKSRFGYRVLFHDTHHRAYSKTSEMLKFHLHKFDGVLAFGEAIRKIYSDGFGLKNVWTFHEAADETVFGPLDVPKTSDVLWIGNWGDEERTRELEEFLVQPAASSPNERFVVYGVRYPSEALERLYEAGIEYKGYLPNLRAPQAYSEAKLALHVPRKTYADKLAGVPTIRVFEALACSATLLCAPWQDAEQLFRPGIDYLTVPDGIMMQQQIHRLLRDDKAREQIGRNGRETILKRHTCAHRAEQLMGIYEELIKSEVAAA